MGDDDNRVEPRLTLVGSGAGTTPERISEIEQRARQLEKASRPKPKKAFAAVMAKKVADLVSEEVSDKEKRRRSLPKKGPRPSLVHPVQREVFGRDQNDEDVILKG
ncbi:MAG: hypothetical protein A2289_12500 [Deltaproteobacteria bacterium RIFOXYA12_FULL_58_15]|nr:MAG: hypothetical protein A2289_12500 [Deltaproteobacteria bacterium RIFOXYA12_FULL_58_15]OGR13870.1 MAG: hypothetical protein A2341_25770 [Deltaproteobacteria bacterium RIFOXYB12_FULL_58_9]